MLPADLQASDNHIACALNTIAEDQFGPLRSYGRSTNQTLPQDSCSPGRRTEVDGLQWQQWQGVDHQPGPVGTD